MSALGQEPNFALQCDVRRELECLVTCAAHLEMSALGHKRTLPALSDQLVREPEERGWHIDANCLCGLEIDDQFELGWLLDRKISWFTAFKYSVDIRSGTAPMLAVIQTIRH